MSPWLSKMWRIIQVQAVPNPLRTVSQSWPKSEQTGKRIFRGSTTASKQNQNSVICAPVIGPQSCEERPHIPPPHVMAQVTAWQEQDKLYRGAACPCVASDDPQLSLSGLRELPCHLSQQPHGNTAEEHECIEDREQPILKGATFIGTRERARQSLLRHCLSAGCPRTLPDAPRSPLEQMV